MTEYSRRVNFYETDLMEIVHHSNYLRFLEEARLDWCVKRGVSQWHGRDKKFLLAVVHTEVRHLSPLRFTDQFTVQTQARLKGAKMIFEYLLFVGGNVTTGAKLAAWGKTEHVLVNNLMKPIKIFPELREIMEKESWNETWHLNL